MNDKLAFTLVWEWPLRIWHWIVVISVTIALLTGLVPQLDFFAIHRIAGISVVALLVFRILWGLIGGSYSRFKHYWTTPKALVQHFIGKARPSTHTAPGILLTIALLLVLLVQSTTGLFTSDDVFYEGPLVQFTDDEIVETASDLHRDAWKFVLAFIGIHLTAHIVYLCFLRSRIPLSMFTGRKLTPDPPTTWSPWTAVVTLTVAVVVFSVLLYYSR